MEKRVLATVKDIFYGVEDHGILTCYITLEMGGCVQSFGGLFLDKEKKGPAFLKEICKLFGTGQFGQHLIGRECYALYCFGKHNETIEGLEVFSRRFTLTQFSRQFDSNVKSRLERQEEHLKNEIEQFKERIKRNRAELKKLKKQYTDWG